jgi:hypothetical protein
MTEAEGKTMCDEPSNGPHQPDAQTAGQWLRSGNLLYTLEQVGWRRGEPIEQNRLMVRVEGGPNASADEVSGLASRLLALLTPASSTTPDQNTVDGSTPKSNPEPHHG